MKWFRSIPVRLFGILLHLYPSPFRQKFGQEMLLDFTDLVEEAGQRGGMALFVVLVRELRDFPLNLIIAHLREGQMSEVFRRGPVHAAVQSAFALSLALITMWTTVQLIYVVMEGQGWLFLLKIVKAFGWRVNFGFSAQLTVFFCSQVVGALLAGIVLAMCLWETPRIKRYLFASILAWAIPPLVVRLIASLLRMSNETLRNTVIDYCWFVLAGLGFGVLFSLIVQDRRKTPWLLIAGIFVYFIAQKLALWLILPLFPMDYSESFNWRDFAYIAGMYSVIGAVIGAILGAVAGWSKRKTLTTAAI